VITGQEGKSFTPLLSITQIATNQIVAKERKLGALDIAYLFTV
jgi:hypothetical protein